MKFKFMRLGLSALFIAALAGCSDNGSTGPAGPAGATGATGATGAAGAAATATAPDFFVTSFHGSANPNTPEALRGPNNSANPVTTITSASVNADGKLVVNFSVKQGTAAFTTLPPTAVTFLLARLTPANATTKYPSYWLNYKNLPKTKTAGLSIKGSDGNPAVLMPDGTTRNQSQTFETGATAGGQFTNNGDGTYTYVSNTKVTDGFTITNAPGNLSPASGAATGNTPPMEGTYAYDATLTHRVAIQMGDPDGAGPATMGANNATLDFVPDGKTPITTREIVAIENCNECHRTLGLHGGGRLDTRLCVMCHTPAHYDPSSGNVIDFKVLIHKVHMGKFIPSTVTGLGTPAVKKRFQVIGFQDSMHDYATVGFPAYPANCTKCHKNPIDAKGNVIRTLANVDNWKTNPSREACGACHDGINYADGTGPRVVGWNQPGSFTNPTGDANAFPSTNLSTTGHGGGAQADNTGCAFCHTSTGVQNQIDTAPAPIPDIHDFTKKYMTGTGSLAVNMTMGTVDGTGTFTAAAAGKVWAVGDKPVLQIVLKDGNGAVIDPNTVGAASGTGEAGFGWDMAIHGPRALRKPVLTTFAVEPIFGKVPAISPSGAVIGVVGGAGYRNKINTRYGQAAASAANGTPAMYNKFAQDDYGVRWTNAAASVAVADATKVTGVINRTANTTQTLYQLATITANITPGTYQAYTYFYAPAPGAVGATAWSNTKGVGSTLINFQVGTATVEQKVASGCYDCHSATNQAVYDTALAASGVEAAYTAASANLWHVNRTDHRAHFNPDYCGMCHDYQVEKDGETDTAAQLAPSANAPYGSGVWKQNKLGFGAMPVSKRVHGLHFGANLNHPDDNPGIADKYIVLPQDVRNCEKCHSSVTTGTWKLTSDTKDANGLGLTAKTPMRIACSGCHDSDRSWLHMTTMTVDPTPNTVTAGSGVFPTTTGPFSGDEKEACMACHASLGKTGTGGTNVAGDAGVSGGGLQ